MNDESIDKMLDDELKHYLFGLALSSGQAFNPDDAVGANVRQQRVIVIRELIKSRDQQIAKAYGGCTNCYGKGYATVNDRWVAHDTDQDIGSPGGTFVGGNEFAIKYCDCERGKQLQKMQGQIALAARNEAEISILNRCYIDQGEIYIRLPDGFCEQYTYIATLKENKQ